MRRTAGLPAGAVVLTSVMAVHGNPPAISVLQRAEDGAVRANDTAWQALRDQSGEVAVERVPLPDGSAIDLRMEPFSVTTDQTQFIVSDGEGNERWLNFNPAALTLLRGQVEGVPGSSAYLAVSETGGAGMIDLGSGAARYVLQWGDPARRGASSEAVIVEASGFGGPVVGQFCGTEERKSAGSPPIESGPPAVGLTRIQVAVETDFEYFELFGDADAAAAYIVVLYGAMSDIYMRDVNARIELSFVRVWDAEENLYNVSNPLSTLRSHWNDNMQAVERDVTQLLTGRRNLPYGGVAYVEGLCNGVAYSVNGYILGSFFDAEAPHFANWDLIVTSHELGHNCGTGHTHNYGIDNCAGGSLQRGTIMSYCHTTTGGNANIDLRFHTGIQPIMESYITQSLCIDDDCNGNGVPDSDDISSATSSDVNTNGIPDECEDCNNNGVLDDVDITSGTSTDLNANGIPDDCEPDCNGNSVPDDKDIADLSSTDANGDGVPDECETDCNANGTSDYAEIQADMTLDIDRNAVLDACQDCNEDGTPDIDELGGALNLWAASNAATLLQEFHAGSGVPVKPSDDLHVSDPQDLILTPSGVMLVSSATDHRVASFDPSTGTFLGDFVTAGAGGLNSPAGMTIGPNGNLFVASRGTDSVIEFDGVSGATVGTFVAASLGGLIDPFGLTFGPNGNLFVTSGDHRVIEYDGGTGALVGDLVSPSDGGLNDPRGLLFKPNGDLLVASFGSDAVLEFDGLGDGFLRQFNRGGLTSGYWALINPWSLRLGPRGEAVYVSSNAGNAAIHTYDVETGLFRRSYYILSQVIGNPTGFDFLPASADDCNMNLIPDLCDVNSGTSEDINGNGLPDECEQIGDLNDDGVVNVLDLLELIANWGACGPSCPHDLNNDGVVNVFDLLVLLTNWG